MSELLSKLKEFNSQLPQLIDGYKLKYRGEIEPLEPSLLFKMMEDGLMVPISRAALLEIIWHIEKLEKANGTLGSAIIEHLRNGFDQSDKRTMIQPEASRHKQ